MSHMAHYSRCKTSLIFTTHCIASSLFRSICAYTWKVRGTTKWLQFILRTTQMCTKFHGNPIVFHSKSQMSMSSWRPRKCLGTMNVCPRFCANLSNSCWVISVWAKRQKNYLYATFFLSIRWDGAENPLCLQENSLRSLLFGSVTT